LSAAAMMIAVVDALHLSHQGMLGSFAWSLRRIPVVVASRNCKIVKFVHY